MRRLLLLSLLVLSSACKKTTTTPTGAEVLRWDKSMATRASVPGAKELGPRTSKEVKVLVHPDVVGPVTLKLHVEMAPLEIIEGKTYRHTSPVEVRATVEANEDWTLAGKCQDGPHYQFGPVGADGVMTSPEAMVLTCLVKMRYVSTFKDMDLLVDLILDGDGTMKAVMASGQATIE